MLTGCLVQNNKRKQPSQTPSPAKAAVTRGSKSASKVKPVQSQPEAAPAATREKRGKAAAVTEVPNGTAKKGKAAAPIAAPESPAVAKKGKAEPQGKSAKPAVKATTQVKGSGKAGFTDSNSDWLRPSKKAKRVPEPEPESEESEDEDDAGGIADEDDLSDGDIVDDEFPDVDDEDGSDDEDDDNEDDDEEVSETCCTFTLCVWHFLKTDQRLPHKFSWCHPIT